MTYVENSVAPPNSIIFIVDPTHDSQVPDDTGAALVTATSSCIAVGTAESSHGETSVRLGTIIQDPVGQLVFDGSLETPGRRLSVENSWLEEILSTNVENAVTRVRIWANDLNEPDVILIEAS
jgi:hypothetical protein